MTFFYMSKFPAFATYVIMFYQAVKSGIWLLLTFSTLLFGFGFTFHFLLRNHPIYRWASVPKMRIELGLKIRAGKWERCWLNQVVENKNSHCFQPISLAKTLPLSASEQEPKQEQEGSFRSEKARESCEWGVTSSRGCENKNDHE